MSENHKGYKHVRGMRNRRRGGLKAEEKPHYEPETLGWLLERWLMRLEELAYSVSSLDVNRRALKSFLEWCELRSVTDPNEVTKPMLESYQRYLFRYRKQDGKPLGVTTQINRLSSLRRFFRWLCREDYIPANPASDLQLPRKPAKLLPKALSDEELNALFGLPDVGDVLGLRDRCMLELFYSCGLRRSELTRVDIEDVDLARSVLTVVKGKGGKSRVVPIGERALGWIERYLEDSRPKLEFGTSERALFLSGYGKRLNPNYVGNWVSRTMKAVGIEKQGSCHLLRHSCATHMLENGADIRFIQQMLGHARLDTTQIYTEVSIRKLQEVHARTHPSGQV